MGYLRQLEKTYRYLRHSILTKISPTYNRADKTLSILKQHRDASFLAETAINSRLDLLFEKMEKVLTSHENLTLELLDNSLQWGKKHGAFGRQLQNLKINVQKIEEDNKTNSEIFEKWMERHEAFYDARKGLITIQNILNCSNSEFADQDYVASQIKEFGLANIDWEERLINYFPESNASSIDWKKWRQFLSWRNNSQFGLLQIPPEFLHFIMDISSLEINTAIEIGVFKGASSYFSAAILQRKNKDALYTMVDLHDQLCNYNEYAKVLNLQKCIPATSDDFKGQEFDFVFIDADHSYDASKRDYENVGVHARKAVVFHDIFAHEYDHLNGGMVRTWNEFKKANQECAIIKEYSLFPNQFMGLGLGILRASSSFQNL